MHYSYLIVESILKQALSVSFVTMQYQFKLNFFNISHCIGIFYLRNCNAWKKADKLIKDTFLVEIHH